MNMYWALQLHKLIEHREPCVVVTILATKGSTPRAIGSKMLVTDKTSFMSIGGGHLEHKAIKISKELLENKEKEPLTNTFSLGASLGQCCGGQVELLFEAFYPAPQNVVVFGAGHVANALIPILAQLPCSVQWVDSRESLFPHSIPANTQALIDEDIVNVCEQLPNNSYVLIMTHNHHLDQQLCERLLNLNNSAFIGLIGSQKKWSKFKLRLARKGFSQSQIEGIHSPIGIDYVKGKLPMEIAVSVSAHLIHFYQRNHSKKLEQHQIRPQMFAVDQ